ncbi:hypothetical protein GE061_001762 [Apolygus lucorum]|uniref:Uncharacterized protein n=1 Tax=Apolygus lucorum TaxID=248454 RepID=A0A8S9X529_APOLU|nr:hypothetical protein GE061_001762 [Apolygus lucorum]
MEHGPGIPGPDLHAFHHPSPCGRKAELRKGNGGSAEREKFMQTWPQLVNTSLLVNLRDNLQKQRVEAERAVRWRDQRIASLCASLSKEKELRAQSLRVQHSAETLLNSLKEHLP